MTRDGCSRCADTVTIQKFVPLEIFSSINECIDIRRIFDPQGQDEGKVRKVEENILLSHCV